MDSVQIQHERAVCDKLIRDINQRQNINLIFSRRGDPAPDLIYSDGSLEIGIEVVTCYYDINDAKIKWLNARGVHEAPRRWSGVDFDDALVMNINRALKKKCEKKAYGINCLLAVNILPSLTTFNEMKELMSQVKVPQQHQFKEIYLLGSFGVSSESNVNFAIWKLFPDSN